MQKFNKFTFTLLLLLFTFRVNAASDDLKWKGSGPCLGVLGLGSMAKSNKSILRCTGKIDFIIDLSKMIFVAGVPKDRVKYKGSGHQILVQSIGSTEGSHICGGMIRERKPEPGSKFCTWEMSGHFGKNWDDEKRLIYYKFMKKNGIIVEHEGWTSPTETEDTNRD